MHECEECGTDVDMPFTCRRCGGKLCGSHRLPENHTCPGQAIDVDLEKGATRRQPAGKLSPSDRSGAGSANPLRDERSALHGPLVTLGTYLLLPFILAYQLLAWTAGWMLSGWRPLLVVGLVAGAAIYGVPGVDTSGITSAIDDGDQGAGDIERLDEDVIRDELHAQVNEQRSAHGLERLDQSAELHEVAAYHSQDMAEHDYFAHESPDGETLEDRYNDHGVSCFEMTGDEHGGGENIASTYAFTAVETEDGVERYSNETEIAESIFEQWMNSPGHRENILHDAWDVEGFGIYTEETTDGVRVYVTQNFC